MSGAESGAEDENTNAIQPETELSHPDYERAGKKYRHIKTGLFASKAEVKAAIEASNAAAAAKAEADRMSENYHKIRLPTWNPAEPQLWFVECEDLFTLAKVKDEDQKTKAILVRRELPAEVKNNIKDLILKPNPSTEYKDLKEAVIAQHKLSREESYIAIGNMTLGDQKPSTLGQGILATIPAKCDCDKTSDGCDYKKWIFECLFKEKLPQSVRNGLVGTELNIKTPSTYLAQADELMASARAKQSRAGAVNEVKDGEIDAVGNRGGGKAGGGKKKETTRPSDICVNHFRYKQKTWKCGAPTSCKYAKNVVPKPETAKKDQKE